MLRDETSGVTFTSHEIDFALNNQTKIIHWLQSAARDFNNEIASLNYYFCDDDAIQKVNKSYLDHDFPTDIITFPYEYMPVEAEIYISIDTIHENAKRFNTNFEQELLRVIIHGLLHMLGLDDKTAEMQKEMTKSEDHYLEVLNNSTL